LAVGGRQFDAQCPCARRRPFSKAGRAQTLMTALVDPADDERIGGSKIRGARPHVDSVGSCGRPSSVKSAITGIRKGSRRRPQDVLPTRPCVVWLGGPNALQEILLGPFLAAGGVRDSAVSH